MLYDLRFKDEHDVETRICYALGRVEMVRGKYAMVRVDEFPDLIKILGKYDNSKDASDDVDVIQFELEEGQFVFVHMVYIGDDKFQHICSHQRENDWVYTIIEEGKKTKTIEVSLLDEGSVSAKESIRDEGRSPSFISASAGSAQEFVNKVARAPSPIIKPEKPSFKPKGIILP